MIFYFSVSSVCVCVGGGGGWCHSVFHVVILAYSYIQDHIHSHGAISYIYNYIFTQIVYKLRNVS